MPWYRRGKQRVYYRSVRIKGEARKVYVGGGEVGQVAASLDARRRAERQAAAEAWARTRNCLAEIDALARNLYSQCELLAVSALLSAGFHRPPNRAPWRKWHAGRKAIKELARAGGRRRVAGVGTEGQGR